jgi:hypothetical protein
MIVRYRDKNRKIKYCQTTEDVTCREKKCFKPADGICLYYFIGRCAEYEKKLNKD